MTVNRLLSEASSDELSAWMAFMEVDARVRKDQLAKAREDQQIMGDE
jgi:hypothetical protein